MGFSALDGLPMGTRCGQIDPGVLLWLMQARGWDARRDPGPALSGQRAEGACRASAAICGPCSPSPGAGGRAGHRRLMSTGPVVSWASLAHRARRPGRDRLHRGGGRTCGADPRSSDPGGHAVAGRGPGRGCRQPSARRGTDRVPRSAGFRSG
jgi:hypothetical protein